MCDRCLQTACLDCPAIILDFPSYFFTFLRTCCSLCGRCFPQRSSEILNSLFLLKPSLATLSKYHTSYDISSLFLLYLLFPPLWYLLLTYIISLFILVFSFLASIFPLSPVVLKLELASESLGGFKMQIVRPHPRVSDLVCLGQVLIICISSSFQEMPKLLVRDHALRAAALGGKTREAPGRQWFYWYCELLFHQHLEECQACSVHSVDIFEWMMNKTVLKKIRAIRSIKYKHPIKRMLSLTYFIKA